LTPNAIMPYRYQSLAAASTHVSRALQTEVLSHRARGNGDIGAVHQVLDSHVG
jgi:hypothetical protein